LYCIHSWLERKNKMKTLVIYFSKFGNTKLVAETVSQRLRSGVETRLISAERLTPADFNNVDLVVIGSPTHKMNIPEDVRPVLGRLPKKILKGKAVAAFDTSYKMSWWLNHLTAGKKLAQKLRKLGGKQVVPPEIFLVTGREGPLYAGEVERANAWAAAILERVKGTDVL